MGSKRAINLARNNMFPAMDAKISSLVTKGTINHKRKVYYSVAQTAAKSLSTDDSGMLIVLGSTVAQIQVFNLPTITDADLGTYFDFVVTTIGNSGAAGSYTINTGGSATSATATPTAGYDDFIGTLTVTDTAAVVASDKTNVVPAAGEGTLVLALDTSNATLAVGCDFRVTAVAASTIGTASGNTWLVTGNLMAADAGGFVTGALFTAP